MRASKIILIATGPKKADAIRGLIMNEDVDVSNPSTMLKMHPDVTVIIDRPLADLVGYTDWKRGKADWISGNPIGLPGRTSVTSDLRARSMFQTAYFTRLPKSDDLPRRLQIHPYSCPYAGRFRRNFRR